MSLSLKNKIIVTVMTLSLPMASVSACGPSFPNRMLVDGDNIVLWAPIVRFQEEIEYLKPPVPPRFKAIVPSEEDGRRPSSKGKPQRYSYGARYQLQTASADVADLENALAALDIGDKRRNDIMDRYRAVRKVLLKYSVALSRWKAQTGWARRRKKVVSDAPIEEEIPSPLFEPPAISKQLPAEFGEYLRGAIFYYQGQPEKAREVWLGLLKRPSQQRLYRSTWAAFMTGKTLLEEDPAGAAKWFQLVRELAEEGFVDSLGLASSSLGWEARAELNMEHYVQAMELYVAQMATGDPTARASLSHAARWAFTMERQMLEKLAGNTTARRVMTAHLLSSSKTTTQKWLDAVEAADVHSVQEADRLAWMAYRVGEMEIAQRWLDVAPPDGVLARWIRAKLLLRAGKVPEAAEHLSQIAGRFPPARQPRSKHERLESIGTRVRGELGVLHLARRQYIEALDVLLQGGYWEDAAYVAERVLTPDELKDHVAAAWPQGELPADAEAGDDISDRENPNWIPNRLRYLLARRLARIGRRKEARPYYPAKWQMRLDAYLQAVRKGHNERLSSQERAAALWKAACIARYEGMELLGTEVEPDWFVYEGHFERARTSDVRSLPSSGELLASSTDEQRRLQQNVVPEKRFHYRYEAADHAWRAVELMPDQSDQTARVLCIAGSWLKDRDPQAADRFYKTLVRRCGKTQLGREADRLRWFPKIEVDKKRLLQRTR
jgi:hypothetical protein